jgi:transportin-1
LSAVTGLESATYDQVRHNHNHLFPWLECLERVADALGVGFAPYAQQMFDACCTIIEKNLLQQQRYDYALQVGQADDLEEGDKEFITLALDVLSAMSEGLGTSMEALVGGSSLLPLLVETLGDSDEAVRMSAFAFLGDIAKTSMAHLVPAIPQVIPLLLASLNPSLYDKNVVNNAAWAAGEIAIKMQAGMAPYISALLNALVPILNTPNLTLMHENMAITLGRLGLVCADLVAPSLPVIAEAWLVNLSTINDPTEKETAFRGLCAVVQKNPQGVLDAFPTMCQAFLQWDPAEYPQVATVCGQILHSFKNLLATQWPQAVGKCSPEVQQALVQRFQL